MFDQTFSYVLAIAALVIGVMLLTGHGSVFMKGGNTQARAQKYDEKKMEKFSGICLILIGIATRFLQTLLISRINVAQQKILLKKALFFYGLLLFIFP